MLQVRWPLFGNKRKAEEARGQGRPYALSGSRRVLHNVFEVGFLDGIYNDCVAAMFRARFSLIERS